MDRERIEREAREIVVAHVGSDPCGGIEDAIMSLVLRERAAVWEKAARACESAEKLALRDRSSEGARTALDCAESIRALAAQERDQ